MARRTCLSKDVLAKGAHATRPHASLTGASACASAHHDVQRQQHQQTSKQRLPTTTSDSAGLKEGEGEQNMGEGKRHRDTQEATERERDQATRARYRSHHPPTHARTVERHMQAAVQPDRPTDLHRYTAAQDDGTHRHKRARRSEPAKGRATNGVKGALETEAAGGRVRGGAGAQPNPHREKESSLNPPTLNNKKRKNAAPNSAVSVALLGLSDCSPTRPLRPPSTRRTGTLQGGKSFHQRTPHAHARGQTQERSYFTYRASLSL